MIRDRGPNYNIGFGVQSRDLDYSQESEGPNPNSGAMARALNDHPIARFMAASAATMVGVVVAGAIVRKGGVKLAVKLQQESSPFQSSLIRDMRKMRDLFDDFQGTIRDAEYYSDKLIPGSSLKHSEGLVVPSERGKYLVGEHRFSDGNPENFHGFFRTQGEKEKAAKLGLESPVDWTLRDELKQRMVTQARRLPYELPAAYVVQRGMTDKIFGENQDKKVNWHNPADVITDFVTQSAKNTAWMFSPLELGAGTATHGWRKLMSYSDDYAHLAPAQRSDAMFKGSQSLKALLEQVGHDAGKIVNSTTKYSAQVSGSFATAIDAAGQSSFNVVNLMHRMRNGGVNGQLRAASVHNIASKARWQEYGNIVVNNDLLDFLPKPFKGMSSGAKAGKARWNAIGEEYSALANFNRMGNRAFNKLYADGSSEQKALGRALQPSDSGIEQMSTVLRQLGGSGMFRHGKSLDEDVMHVGFKNSEFYKSRMKTLYENRFYRELGNQGVADNEIELFRKTLSLTPNFYGKSSGIAGSLTVGGKPVMAQASGKYGGQTFWNSVLNDVGVTDASAQARLRNALPQAYKNSEQMFRKPGYLNAVDRRISREWKHAQKNSFPSYLQDMVGSTRAPYSQFMGNVGGVNKEYLLRQVAKQRGFDPYDGKGVIRSLDQTKKIVRSIGFDPDDTDTMRSFLTGKGVIAKPWNKRGGNAFGWSPVTLAASSQNRFFRGSPAEDEIDGLVRHLDSKNPSKGVTRHTLPGVYRTAQGEVVDLNRLKTRGWNFLDKLSSSTQIPLIHTSPLKLLGYDNFRSLRKSPAIQMMGGHEAQPFLPKGAMDRDGFALWMRNKHGTSGKVTAYSSGKDGFFGKVLAGAYKSQDVSGSGVSARTARLAIGDLGRISTNPPEPRSRLGQRVGADRINWFKNLMRVDPDQPDSFWGWKRRFADRKTDVRNPTTLARLLRDGEIDHPTHGKLKLDKSGSVVDPSGKVVFNAKELSGSIDDLSVSLRGKQIPGSLFAPDKNGNNAFRSLFEIHSSGDRVIPRGNVNLNDLHSHSEVLDFAEQVLKLDRMQMKGFSPEVQQSMGQASSIFVSRHLRGATGQGSYWDEILPGRGVSGSIVTRMDQLKSDLQKYMIVRGGLTGDDAAFKNTMQGITQELSSMKSAGKISDAQFTEARAALLGMSIDFSKVKGYGRTKTPLESFQSSLGHLRGLPNKTMLDDVSQGVIHSGANPPVNSGVSAFFRSHFGAAQYKFEGTEYNPFRSQRVAVPTFGTVWQRSPMRAISNVAGVSTYSDPQSFSGMSTPMSHLIERINRYSDIAGVAVDPTKFKGPLDLYARGMVGMRALPIVGGLAGIMTVDRTAGGLVHGKDENGERQYSPLVLGTLGRGVVEGQAAISGIVPGGMGYGEKRDQLLEGEVPIRQGRFWLLGNTPFKGGQIQYHRASWYRKMMAGGDYTSDTYGSPLERAMFGYDFSPGKLLDPYHYERKHKDDRPYPLTGEMFTGPWGPLTPILNATIGKMLKPQISLHGDLDDIMAQSTSQMVPMGNNGMQYAPPVMAPGPGGLEAGNGFGTSIGNGRLANAGKVSLGTGRSTSVGHISAINEGIATQGYQKRVGESSSGYSAMPAMPVSGFNRGVNNLAQTASAAQDLFGMYGFMFGTAKESLGFGSSTFAPQKPQLETADRGMGMYRGWKNMNLGGLGDVTNPLSEGSWANLEFSEIVRRFVYNERSGTQYFNPIENQMGKTHPWLPGSEYFTDFKRGDPFTKVTEGEIRMPGVAYERLNQLHSDGTGRYGAVDQLNILGDVAPYSRQYSNLAKQLGSNPAAEETLRQVEARRYKNEFTPYRHMYEDPLESAKHPFKSFLGRAGEVISHHDSFLNSKFLRSRTAVEDWERDHVYGATFPEWQDPIEDYIKPLAYKATQRNPLAAASALGVTGSLFGRTPQAKAFGAVIGGMSGLSASVLGNLYEGVSGKRYMPKHRKQELALDEYIDILSYMKNTSMSSQAQQMGDGGAATTYSRKSNQTMYGLDLATATVQDMIMAVPKRKREHFETMLYAPEKERKRILSTAGRLERRMFEAAWGMDVEARPDLDEYFSNKELPGPEWEGWHPNTNMDTVKIKVAQHMGLDLSEMGYYPQQVAEANLMNPSYPGFGPQFKANNPMASLRRMMNDMGVNGDVQSFRTPFGGDRVEVFSGV